MWVRLLFTVLPLQPQSLAEHAEFEHAVVPQHAEFEQVIIAEDVGFEQVSFGDTTEDAAPLLTNAFEVHLVSAM